MMCILLHNLTFRKWKNTFFFQRKVWYVMSKKKPSKPNTQLQIAILSDTCNDHIFQYNYLCSKVSTYFLHSIKYSETYFFIEFGHKKIKFSTFYSNNFEQCVNCIFLPCCVCMFFCSFISAIQTEPMILCLPILFSTFQLLRVMGKCIPHVSLQIFQFRWSKIQIFYSRAPLRPWCINPSTIYDLSVLH